MSIVYRDLPHMTDVRDMLRTRRLIPGLSIGLVLAAALAVCVSAARAQTAPGMDGRALDANPQVGSGGFNAPIQHNLFNTSNLYVTGNVTGGRAFRGFSPIWSTNSIEVGLPSSSLNGFERDSLGVSDVTGYRSFAQTNPYFSSTQTVTSVGMIASGLNQPGSSVPRNTYLAPNAGTYGTAALQASAPDITFGYREPDRVVPNSSLYNADNMALLRGTALADRLRLTTETDALRQGPQYNETVTQTSELLPRATGDGLYDPYALSRDNPQLSKEPFVRRKRLLGEDRTAPTSEDMLANSRDLLSPTALAPRVLNPMTQSEERDPFTGRPLPAPPAYLATPADRAADTVASRDRMSQTAAALLRANPPAGGQIAYGPQVDEGDELAELPQTVDWLTNFTSQPDAQQQMEMYPSIRAQYERAMAAIAEASTHTVLTLADAADERVSDYIVRAEREMRSGQYYKAASLYRLATGIAPDDALVRLGYANALIAAGEYATATLHLTRAIEGYSAIGLLRLDLNAFIGNPEVLDLRRADLERRLEEKEDYKLRFLLGYVETFTGFRKFGMPNLRKAAAEAPEDSVIRRLPDMLSIQERLTPPAATPSEASGAAD